MGVMLLLRARQSGCRRLGDPDGRFTRLSIRGRMPGRAGGIGDAMAVPVWCCPRRGRSGGTSVTRAAAALVALLLVVTACSSGDDASVPTAATEPTSATEAPNPTSPSDTTTTSTLVTTTTASPPATTEPLTTTPTTTDDENSGTAPFDEEGVRDGFAAVVSSWAACLEALPDCDLASLSESRIGEQLEENQRRVQSFIDAGYRIGDSDTIVYEIESIDFVSDGEVALVGVCVTDASVIYLPDPTGGDDRQIINDSFVSSREVFQMELHDERWVAASNVVTEEEVVGEENNRCA